MVLTPAYIAVNTVFLIAALVLILVITRAGVVYSMNNGNSEAQGKMIAIILRAILALVLIGLCATVFNIVTSFL